MLGRGDDVGEEHGREHAVDVDDGTLAGQELCDLLESERSPSRSTRSDPVAGQFNEPRLWDVTGEVSAVVDGGRTGFESCGAPASEPG